MQRFDNRTKQARQAIYLACCLLFVSFAFLYLFAFQSDMLTMVQHILSKGRTSYQVFLFSAMITVLLSVLPFVKARFVTLPTRAIALCWFPSFLLLGWLTDVALSEVDSSSLSVGPLPFVLATVLYLVATFLLPQIQEVKEPNTPLANLMWPNLAVMVVGMAFAMGVANTNRTVHFELRLERMIMNGQLDKLLDVCSHEKVPSRTVMSVRAYALSCQNKLGDQLFFYPNNVGGETLLPPPSDSLRPANMPAILRKHLGGYPIHDMHATRYLQYLASSGSATSNVRDYLLCAYLLDKNLPTFVDSLIVYYGPKDSAQVDEGVKTAASNVNVSARKTKKAYEPVRFTSLPRHYAEALLLYMRQTENPVAVLDDDKTLENYLSFLKLYKENKDPILRESACRNYYNETYWTFYFFTE